MKLHNFDIDALTCVDVEMFFRSVWSNLQIETAMDPHEVDACQAKWAVLFPTCCEIEIVAKRMEQDKKKEFNSVAKNGADFDRQRKADDAWFMAQLAEGGCNRMQNFNIALMGRMKNMKMEHNNPASSNNQDVPF